jgi:hypothetical protein
MYCVWKNISYVTRRVLLDEQELPPRPEHLSQFTIRLSGVRVSGSLVFCLVLCRSLCVFSPFSVRYDIVCPSSN